MAMNDLTIGGNTYQVTGFSSGSIIRTDITHSTNLIRKTHEINQTMGKGVKPTRTQIKMTDVKVDSLGNAALCSPYLVIPNPNKIWTPEEIADFVVDGLLSTCTKANIIAALNGGLL